MGIGNAAGYPGVFQGNPHPYPWKPLWKAAQRFRAWTVPPIGNVNNWLPVVYSEPIYVDVSASLTLL